MRQASQAQQQHDRRHDGIPLLAQERWATRLRAGWGDFIASVPMPALWVTAHVDLSTSRSGYAALDHFRRSLHQCRSRDSRANQYRIFLQKVITQLNRKILRSRSHERTFSFRGCLETNGGETSDTNLHFHFFLWDPAGFFARDHSMMDDTTAALESLWLNKVNRLATSRYKPIDIKPVLQRDDATNCARYLLKNNCFTASYELFDDWIGSRLTEHRASSRSNDYLNKT